MPCYYPIDGWRASKPNEQGKFPIVFNRAAAQIDSPIKLPCGRCIGCRLERSREWGLRSLHEASQHKENCFLTLTFNDENLPTNYSICVADVQKFLKALRHKIHPKKIRFLACGEYGEDQDITTTDTIGRPHYHLLIFGHDFADKVIHQTQNDQHHYTSETLDKIWGKGFCIIGDLTQESAQYVARYSMKKITGDDSEEHYKKTDPETGEIHTLQPEFLTSSNRPGIGHDWFLKYGADLKKGYITHNGVKHAIPKYYLKLFERTDEEHALVVKERKRINYNYHDPETQNDRLRVKEKIKINRTKILSRNL